METDTKPASSQEDSAKKKHGSSKKRWLTIGIILGVVILVVLLICWLNTRPLFISGKLLGKDGQPFADGTYAMRIRLFDIVNNANMVFDETQSVEVKDTNFTAKIKPAKGALVAPNLAVICLYNVNTEDPQAELLACKEDDEASQADALVCSPYYVEEHALDWNHVLIGDNHIPMPDETAYCDDDPKATVGTKLNVNRLANAEIQQAADILTDTVATELADRIESGDYADVTERFIERVTEGTVLDVSGSGPITSTGGQNPVVGLVNGTTGGQVLQWDGTAWGLRTISSGSGPINVDNPSTWSENQGSDEEFDDTTTNLPNGWQWVNQGTATYSEEYGTGVMDIPAESPQQAHLLVRSLPADWQTITGKATYSALATADFISVGLSLRESSTGKLLTSSFVTGGGSFGGSNYASSQEMIDATADSNCACQNVSWPQTYFRITRKSATAWDFQTSTDGTSWITAATDKNYAGMSADQIGFFVRSGDQPVSASIDWLRIR